MLDWIPEPFKSIKDLPANMSSDLREHIEKETTNDEDLIPSMVWLSCHGKDDLHAQRLGNVSYSPWRGFPTHYFPYQRQPDYQQPLVALHVHKPHRDVVIEVRCEAWAHNIQPTQDSKIGTVHFRILVPSTDSVA